MPALVVYAQNYKTIFQDKKKVEIESQKKKQKKNF